MRAVVCNAFSDPQNLAIEDLPPLAPRAGQVIVRVEAAGVNFSDSLIVSGKFQIKPRLPFVPGGEVAGTVTDLGEGVTDFALGDRIVAGMDKGGLAEEAIVDVRRAMKIPEGMSFTEAAAFFSNYGTSLHAIEDCAEAKPGETILILGAAGGVGGAGIEIAKALGLTVIAAASSAEKLEACRKRGADIVLNYTEERLNTQIKAHYPDGIDIVLDPVGGEQTEAALRALARYGRLLVVGFASGTIPQLPANLLLLKSARAIGLTRTPRMLGEPDWLARHRRRLNELYETGDICPTITEVLPLDAAPAAMAALAERRSFGKLVVAPRQGAGRFIAHT